MERLRRLGAAPAPLLVVGAAFSIQFGAALATTAFDTVGPLGFVWLRVGLAAVILLALHAGALRRSGSRPLRWVLAAGARSRSGGCRARPRRSRWSS